MIARPLRAAALAATAFLGLSACSTYGDYGYGGRTSYSVGLGYGSGPYYGWYDDYYYPGSGYYVYDRVGRRHSWTDSQRRYWEGRRGDRRENWRNRENWRDYRSGVNREAWAARREAWRAERQRQGIVNPDRQARREAWRAQRQQQGVTAPAPRIERQRSGGSDGAGWRGRRRGD